MADKKEQTRDIRLPLDLDHTCWRARATAVGKRFKDGFSLSMGPDHITDLSDERWCPACAYIRGFKDGVEQCESYPLA